MADLPIPFSAPMVRALLDGRKTQTRRVVDVPQMPFDAIFNDDGVWHIGDALTGHRYAKLPVRYRVGDRLYVREHWRCSAKHDATAPRDLAPRSMTIAFEAGGSIANQDSPDDWRPSEASYTDANWMGRFRQGMHMPRWASRLTLTVTEVRVQQLQDITEADAAAEGLETQPSPLGISSYYCFGQIAYSSAKPAFSALWNSLHGPYAWDSNPWVAAYSFTVVKGNIDQIGGDR